MPQMADIVIKKADGTTNATYSQHVPSAGDNSPAIWRNNGVGTKVNQRPEFRLLARSPLPGKRTVKTNFVWPLVDPVTSQVTDYVTVVVESKVSENAIESDVTEAVTQGLNLHAATLVKECFVKGIPAT